MNKETTSGWVKKDIDGKWINCDIHEAEALLANGGRVIKRKEETNKEDWEVIFDKEEYWRLDGKNPDTDRPIFTRVNRELKEFIRDLLSTQEEKIRKEEKKITGETSDGYHTFNELYEHRHLLFLHLMKRNYGWKTLFHADGTMFEGMFLACANLGDTTVDYHLPLKYWDLCEAEVIDKAPEWDGHTSYDVLQRLSKELLKYGQLYNI